MVHLREALSEQNPWWKGRPFPLEYQERQIYGKIRKFLPERQILALTGLRRVGKTTLLLKAGADVVDEGMDPRRVLYFSFDEFRQTDLRSVLNEYETVLGASLSDEKTLILLDEIQKLDGWQDELKAFYDRVGKNAKILVSGSESLFIRKGSRESLAGRLYEFRVDPLTFDEYLTFRDQEREPIGLYERELALLFEEYAKTQGFPELVGVRDQEILRKYLQDSIVDKVVFRDLPALLGLRDTETLRALLNILMEQPGQILKHKALASELGVSRFTISNYLQYLEDAFLIRKLYNHSTGRRKVERKLKKYYPTIVSANLLFKDDSVAQSKVFEWLVVNQLKAEYFWRDKYKREVDAVLVNGKPVPVEIKYGRVSVEGVTAFMSKFQCDDGFVITRREEGERLAGGRKVRLVPAFKFLLGQATSR